ncbi:LPS-assembly lipoprotein [Hoeflea marina]|uniref:LPS-assembly lipoprotein n=1 Tax=Hoeflea marina TaxID=274592 RepID=A0A317PIY7_9HYPH|nr:LPS assembly lipoprotein LptE [Hoeflea marina]PWW00559.1 LPS-assembly lipoprotein [Hoeflea marina]
MSSSDRNKTRLAPLALGLLVASSLLAGCQVRPLYGEGGADLAGIEIKPATTRVEQVVRNELIFKFGGGAGEPASPDYTLALRVQGSTGNVLAAGTDNDFTAARTTVSGTYTLTARADGKVIASGVRAATALLDLPSQNYARLRAIRDGEDRAARSLAAMIEADIAAKLSR